ncbi:UDP-2,4-diacetamido-2,4,6-trideoxy-beta-L-altropyranose hydrolase [Stutzerimonas kirkiae]|uniref:UDP-2,4-diacetamido-2,4, 6-trideoxy-beta-L-altropyranose hydrolase n=1 Tax=Stutzerimonas kirkiae TaxID=2211392 RepID=UPI0010385390|nr:UDP-2,4-diacetamido-2,4,6-trideoxy-beta-L-altropyranose hydrolase [Stutzerimonas kirkiae]TBV10797.1 UDP-2,4-diacetamido-2,4,6-trideoxy-beta-L-altropyranose hydrolase [Stutzerimonas kirkiae]TBV14584.1 UDP-2,4-diacetamido-2,4,6-trideoxy-beta-L-altropyranose hydrolase [Stutzerimonas kirkiae]
MKVVFRADASLQIGTGHVMRCLTLADALGAQGVDCQFICRKHQGNLIGLIGSKGYTVHTLPTQVEFLGASSFVAKATGDEQAPAHIHWLGVTQEQDAEACIPILAQLRPDWLIVDHYALDAQWELALKPHYQQLMVIDDLADRQHHCDLLLDQTFGRDADDYQNRVPADCRLLCGSQYALLRPEFSKRRSYSLERRATPELRSLLITMGGVDKDNITGRILKALEVCPLPARCQITVVMGMSAPWLEDVSQQAKSMSWPTRVMAGVRDMAQIMADSDLAIGAAGATSWERCCLGLPTVMLVLANNQRAIAQALYSAGAAHLVDVNTLGEKKLLTRQQIGPNVLSAMSAFAATVTDGLGTPEVITFLNRQG